MKEYLEKNNIIYYIHTSQDTWYKRNVERDYLKIEDLIKCYFTVKKYEYGDFTVYAKEI